MTWTAPSADPVDGSLTGPERAVLAGFLDWQRSTLLNICAGLTPEQLASRPVPASSLSLLGIVRHLTKVERTWLRQRVAGEDVEPVFDPALGQDADFDLADPDEAERDHARLVDEWRLCDTAVADRDLDEVFLLRGEEHSLRLVYVHLVAEYARHNGHADLIRQSLDGVTGR